MSDVSLVLDTVVSRMFSENAYIAHLQGRSDCLIFDPGLDADDIIARVTKEKLTPAAILNTHGHADHIAGNDALKRCWPQCPLIIGAGDAPKLTSAELNLSAGYGIPVTSPPADELIQEPHIFRGAGFELEVLDTPGHSCGHVVFVWKGGAPWVVFGGDVLFQGSIGRTDFPDGSFSQLASAIHHKLFTLPDDTLVLPGHGPATSIGLEKETNPYVGRPAGYQG